MEPDRWKQVDALLQAALERPPDERDAFLRQACGDDAGLAEEIQSLLTAGRHAGSFLEGGPAGELVARALAHELTSQAQNEADDLVGCQISHYRVIAKLGGGGMGVVYKAEDTRLHRPVALKFLSAELASDRDALIRFQREARAASALNHSNICTVYDIGEQDGRAFIALEFLDGTTLKERIDGRTLDVPTVLAVAIDVLDALEAAHAAGIIHRDIKPANLFVTPRERGKVLDFGVAKLDTTGRAALMAPTVTGEANLTALGDAVGTRPYMSPEQVRGEVLDARSDLFSFGVVLYEMATGVQPFVRETPGLIFDAILNRDPVPASQLNPDVPPGLDGIIQKALAKERDLRYQHASEIRADLQGLMRDPQFGAVVMPSPKSGARRWQVAAPVLGVALTSILAGYLYLHRSPVLTDKDTIVLADFTNTTGEPIFDGLLRQGLSVQLGQSPFLSLVSDQRVRQQLTLMNQPADAALTPALARELCERIASAAVVEGSIAALGRRYVLGLRARHCTTGEVIFDEQAQAGTKEDVLDVLSRMASNFRTGVGESLASVEQHAMPLAEATTSSLEALKAFSAARSIVFSSGTAASVPLHERAIALDPDFAMAHASLGLSYSNLGESSKSMQYTTRAYQLRHRATDRERYFIETMYDRQVTGNLEKEQQTLESWAQTYPREAHPHGLMAGFATTSPGNFESSIEAAQQAIGLDPDMTLAYASLAFSQLHLGRTGDAEATLQRASARKLEVNEFTMLRYFIALVKSDSAGMKREVALAKGKRGLEDWISHADSLALARSGRLQEARRVAGVARDLAHQAGRRERAAMFESGVAVWESFYGNAAAARQNASAALELTTGRDVTYAAAFALALSGEMSRARALADDLEKRFPEDTSVRFSYVPTLRALFR